MKKDFSDSYKNKMKYVEICWNWFIKSNPLQAFKNKQMKIYWGYNDEENVSKKMYLKM